MLGLRNRSEATRKVLLEIKVSNPSTVRSIKVQRERKISEIKEINRYSIQLRISQIASALRGFAR